jgi:ubiquitin carboxyl-terminal hydrolase 34
VDSKEEEWKEHRGQLIDDNVLHQLQKMFSNLEMSNKKAYDPEGFCFSFKDF